MASNLFPPSDFSDFQDCEQSDKLDKSSHPNIVWINEDSDGMSLYYPTARNRGMGVALSVGGLLLCTVPAFIGQSILTDMNDSGMSWIFGAFGLVFFLVAGMTALALMGLGVYMISTNRMVHVRNDGVYVMTRTLGIPFKHFMARNEVEALVERVTVMSPDEEKARYSLFLVGKNGEKLNVGDGINGLSHMRAVKRTLGSALGIAA